MSLGLYSGIGGPSAHSDVLDAAPDTIPSKRGLVEELKRRGRATVGSKNYPEAERLYGKGIDVTVSILDETKDDESKKDLAILHSNRSLCRMQLGKTEEALEDADSAVKYDPAYTKAHWRQGTARTARGRHGEAIASFEKALSLEPGNKALKKEVASAKTRQEKEAAAQALAAEAAENAKDDVEIKETTTAKAPSEKKVDAKPKAKSASSDAPKSKDKDDGSVFTKSDHVKGYKIRSDGKKTSFFDREISDEAKRMIGDIAPKKIDPNANGAVDDANAPKKIGTEGTSAWNKAGTWEERDVTAWAKETLENVLLTSEFTLPEGSPSPGAHGKLSKISKLNGSCSYATVRGKKRYIYEFGFTVHWELKLGADESEICRGTMTFPDVDGTVELGEGYDIVDYSVEGSSSAGTGPLLERFVRNAGLRDSIHKTIDDWVRLFRATY